MIFNKINNKKEMEKDKLLEKLRKLTNLKVSAQALGNEGEANAAAAAITRLLLEYNLTNEDIPTQEKSNNPIVSVEIPFKAEMDNGRWYADLVAVVCEYNMCRSLIISISNNGRMQRSKFQIVGRQKNVEIVLYLISFLSHQFTSIGKTRYAQYKQECFKTRPQSMVIFLKSFLYGCVIGLNDKLKESKNNLSSETGLTALIQVTDTEIDNFLKGKKIGPAKKSKAKIDPLSVKQGIHVGKNIEICKGIHADITNEKSLFTTNL